MENNFKSTRLMFPHLSWGLTLFSNSGLHIEVETYNNLFKWFINNQSLDSHIPQNNRWHTPSLTKTFSSKSKVLFTCKEMLHQNSPLNIFHRLLFVLSFFFFFLHLRTSSLSPPFSCFPVKKHRGWGLEVRFGSELKRVPLGGGGVIWQVFNKFFRIVLG